MGEEDRLWINTGLYALELPDRFPRLHAAGPCRELAVPAGWRHAFEDMLHQIDTLLSDEDASVFRILQAKEKLGGLRVYFQLPSKSGGTYERLQAVVERACMAAAETCEVCGQAGKLRSVDRLRTVCEAHSVDCESLGFAGSVLLPHREQAFEALRALALEGFEAAVPATCSGELELNGGEFVVGIRQEDLKRPRRAQQVIERVSRMGLFAGALLTPESSPREVGEIFERNRLVYSTGKAGWPGLNTLCDSRSRSANERV